MKSITIQESIIIIYYYYWVLYNYTFQPFSDLVDNQCCEHDIGIDYSLLKINKCKHFNMKQT